MHSCMSETNIRKADIIEFCFKKRSSASAEANLVTKYPQRLIFNKSIRY